MSDESRSVQFFDGKDLPPLTDSDVSFDEPLGWSVRLWHFVNDKKNLGFILLVVLYVAWFIHLSLLQYYAYGDPPFDLAIFDQGMWLISPFHIPFVTVMGRNLFGDHTDRKSTRLNSSHRCISYAVFCLK